MGGDHALWPKALKPTYPYSESGYPPQDEESEYPDPWVSIAAMAASTTTLKFTTGVYVLPLRNPIDVAKATATLSIISDGRFILGAGAGWMKEEFDVYGVDFSTRGKRLDECIEAIQILWKNALVEYHGQFVDFPLIRLVPSPSKPIPIYIGGDNDRALRRAAKYGDGWIGAGNTPDAVPSILEKINTLRTEYGRGESTFETIVGLYAEQSVELLKSLQGKGMTSTVNMPFEYSLGKNSSIDQKKRVMEQYAKNIIIPMNII